MLDCWSTITHLLYDFITFKHSKSHILIVGLWYAMSNNTTEALSSMKRQFALQLSQEHAQEHKLEMTV